MQGKFKEAVGVFIPDFVFDKLPKQRACRGKMTFKQQGDASGQAAR